MAINIKMGSHLFSKQRKIAELQKQNSELKQKFQTISKINIQLEKEKRFIDKEAFDIRNRYKIMEIQHSQMQKEVGALKETID